MPISAVTNYDPFQELVKDLSKLGSAPINSTTQANSLNDIVSFKDLAQEPNSQSKKAEAAFVEPFRKNLGKYFVIPQEFKAITDPKDFFSKDAMNSLQISLGPAKAEILGDKDPNTNLSMSFGDSIKKSLLESLEKKSKEALIIDALEKSYLQSESEKDTAVNLMLQIADNTGSKFSPDLKAEAEDRILSHGLAYGAEKISLGGRIKLDPYKEASLKLVAKYPEKAIGKYLNFGNLSSLNMKNPDQVKELLNILIEKKPLETFNKLAVEKQRIFDISFGVPKSLDIKNFNNPLKILLKTIERSISNIIASKKYDGAVKIEDAYKETPKQKFFKDLVEILNQYSGNKFDAFSERKFGHTPDSIEKLREEQIKLIENNVEGKYPNHDDLRNEIIQTHNALHEIFNGLSEPYSDAIADAKLGPKPWNGKQLITASQPAKHQKDSTSSE